MDTPSREYDLNTTIVRIPVLQLLIDRVLLWRDNRFKNDGTAIPSPNKNAENNSFGEKHSSLLTNVIRWANTFSFILTASIWLFWNRRKIDILHVHIGDWLAGYGGWIGARLGIPVLCKAANMPALPQICASIPFHRVWDRWRREIYFVALHNAIRDELVAGRVGQRKIRTIPNGVKIPSENAEPSTGKYVLYVGNFSQGAEHKGFDVLCKAWAKVHLENPEAKLVMAGQGDATPWRKMLQHLGVESGVDFVGYLQQPDELYHQAALFVLPSRHEGMSNALLEAQAWGLPAVVSAIPGNSAIVKDGVTGIVVPVGDHLALANAILGMLADPQQRKQMGTNARVRTTEHFSIDRVGGLYVMLYEDILRKQMV